MAEITPIGDNPTRIGTPQPTPEAATPNPVDEVTTDQADVRSLRDEDRDAKREDDAAAALERMHLAHQAMFQIDNQAALQGGASENESAVGAVATSHDWTAEVRNDSSGWSYDEPPGGALDAAVNAADWTYTNAFEPRVENLEATAASERERAYEQSQDDARRDETTLK